MLLLRYLLIAIFLTFVDSTTFNGLIKLLVQRYLELGNKIQNIICIQRQNEFQPSSLLNEVKAIMYQTSHKTFPIYSRIKIVSIENVIMANNSNDAPKRELYFTEGYSMLEKLAPWLDQFKFGQNSLFVKVPNLNESLIKSFHLNLSINSGVFLLDSQTSELHEPYKFFSAGQQDKTKSSK